MPLHQSRAPPVPLVCLDDCRAALLAHPLVHAGRTLPPFLPPAYSRHHSLPPYLSPGRGGQDFGDSEGEGGCDRGIEADLYPGGLFSLQLAREREADRQRERETESEREVPPATESEREVPPARTSCPQDKVLYAKYLRLVAGGGGGGGGGTTKYLRLVHSSAGPVTVSASSEVQFVL